MLLLPRRTRPHYLERGAKAIRAQKCDFTLLKKQRAEIIFIHYLGSALILQKLHSRVEIVSHTCAFYGPFEVLLPWGRILFILDSLTQILT